MEQSRIASPELAKPALDIGLFTNDLARVSEFWVSHAGVEFDFVQPISRGVKQHRFNFGDGVLKVNETKAPLNSGPTGFRRVLVAGSAVQESVPLCDSDGTSLVLWPRGREGITHWAVEVAAPSEAAFLDFYEKILGLPRADQHPCAVQCGVSLLVCVVGTAEELPESAAIPSIDALQMRGLRYVTLQVKDVDTVTARVRQADGCVALEPTTLGETARISFVRDPIGNYIELSQRTSLTGALPRSVE